MLASVMRNMPKKEHSLLMEGNKRLHYICSYSCNIEYVHVCRVQRVGNWLDRELKHPSNIERQLSQNKIYSNKAVNLIRTNF